MKLPVGYVPGQGVHKATAYGGFGQKLLESMGWKDGQGLGKDNSGMKKAIEVKKKEDNAGVGNAPGWQWDKKYWEDAYNSVSIAVPEAEGGAAASDSTSSDSDSSSDTAVSSSSSSDSDSDSSDSDSDDGNDNVAVNRDGTITTASKAELRLVAELAKDPWGRWGGRQGKMARIRQQEEMQAELARKQLGLEAAPGPASTAAASASAARPSKQQKAGKSPVDAAKAGSSKKRQKSAAAADAQEAQAGDGVADGEGAPKKKPKRVVVDLGGQLPATYFEFTPTPREGWWGAKYFITAGCLEGLLEEGVARERKSFNEDDQAALYMSAHDNQRQGKRGLGKSTTLKIAGGKWEGSKKTFGEEEEELGEGAAAGEAPSAADAERSAAGAEGSRLKVKGKGKAKKAKQQKEEEEEEAGRRQAGDGQAPGSGVPKAKWIKLAKAAFKQEAAIKLKWKKLWKRVAAELSTAHGAVDLAACQEQLRKKLAKSDKFELRGKSVKLL